MAWQAPVPQRRRSRRSWLILGSVFLGAGVLIVAWGMTIYAKSKEYAAPGDCTEAWSVLRAGVGAWGLIALSGALVGGALYVAIVMPLEASATRLPPESEPHYHTVRRHVPWPVETEEECWSNHEKFGCAWFLIAVSVLMVGGALASKLAYQPFEGASTIQPAATACVHVRPSFPL